MDEKPVSVGLFVTCLVDLMRPSVGFAAAKLLEDAGCKVSVPTMQTCCGQPSFNSGDRLGTREIARRTIDAFADVDYVVAPSGSCAAMLKLHYPALFDDDDAYRQQAGDLAGRTYELTDFLVTVRRVSLPAVEAPVESTITYHDGCSGLRELGIKEQPRQLLGQISGLRLCEGACAEACCGFGGTFCTSYPDISEKMVDNKVDDIVATGAETVLGGDLGCLLNIAGRLRRRGKAVKVRHVAELLVGGVNHPAIGEAANRDDEEGRWS